jgi:hypothetical protein
VLETPDSHYRSASARLCIRFVPAFVAVDRVNCSVQLEEISDAGNCWPRAIRLRGLYHVDRILKGAKPDDLPVHAELEVRRRLDRRRFLQGVPSIGTLEKIAKILKVKVGRLLE